MILYHYDISPYSEKIRLMLGHAGMAWQSMKVPPMPPRSALDPMLGGYRRIPVSQVGADFFCDTRIITHEIAVASDKPALSFYESETAASEFASFVNEQAFMPIVQGARPASVLKAVATRHWPWHVLGLIKDRAQVAKSTTAPRQSRSQREEIIEQLKQQLEEKSQSSAFLFGDAPSIADFAAYHVVWFADLTRPGRFLKGLDAALNWQTRMQEIGHGQHEKTNQASVFAAAKENEPRAIAPAMRHHEDIGRTVSIAPTDYAQDATKGTLVGADGDRWIIARESDEFGTLHVHFPQHGYEMTLC